MKLYMIRHGQSHVNVTDFESLPSMDAGLTEKGHRQATALGKWLGESGAAGDALYASSLRRAQETASHVSQALKLPILIEDRLREIGSSDMSGLPIDEVNLPRRFIDQWPNIAPFAPRATDFDGVESWMHLRIRLAQFVEELILKHMEQQIYVVAHGGVMAAMFDNLFNVGPYRRCDIDTQHTSCTLFEYRPQLGREPWYLHYHNRIDHFIGTDLI